MTSAHQALLPFTISWSLLKLMSIESVMPSNHLIFCCPLLLLPSIFPRISVFSNETAPHMDILCAKSPQSCPTLGGPMDCSPPGSFVHGILHARILEWVLCPPPGDLPNQGSNLQLLCRLHWKVGSSPLMPPGKPIRLGISTSLKVYFRNQLA